MLSLKVPNTLHYFSISDNLAEEADYIGLLAASRACYSPQKAIPLWERMMKLGSQSGLLTLLSSHPSAKDRLQKLRQWLPAAEQERLAYCAQTAKRQVVGV